MSKKNDLASYLASLLAIMDSKEDAGIPRGATLGREYSRSYQALREIIDKEEKENETGTS